MNTTRQKTDSLELSCPRSVIKRVWVKCLKPTHTPLFSVAAFAYVIGITIMMSQGLFGLARNHTTDENAIFDFETNTTEGWENSTKEDEKGISGVYVTSDESHQSQYSLVLETHLDNNNQNLKQGIAFVMFPGNMEERSISAWVKCPQGAKGDEDSPNGIQLFVKDQGFRSQFAPWRNIGESIPENIWTEVSFTPSRTNPPGGYTDAGFDPTKIMIVGIKLGVGENSDESFIGECYLDFVNLGRAPLIIPDSDHISDFNELTPEQQRDKPFGYGPYWNADPGWGADAWSSNDITIRDGALAITATFTLTNTNQKGFVGVELKPNLDINNKTNRVLRAEVKFDPYIEPERMLASIWLYDRRDAGPDCQGNDCKWFRSQDTWIGGSVWNELVFDLDDPSHFFTDTTKCPNCLLPTDVITASLKNILKLGIQFYANEPYTGTIYLDNVTIGGTEITTNTINLNEGFVTRSGSQFLLDGLPYRFAGNNAYYLFYKSHYMIDDVMETMQRNGIRVIRTWGFSDGKAPYADDGDGGIPNGNEGSAFQPEPGLYYEPTFVNFDYVIKSAGEHGIRLIIPLVNYWSDKDVTNGQNSFGGMGQYVEWSGIAEYENGDIVNGRIINKTHFYTDTETIQLYKDYIAYILNRVNTLTDVAYKDDPTILAWELANESRCQESDGCSSTDPVLYTWAEDMSKYIKSLDSTHMVGLGDEGFLNEQGNPDPYYNGSLNVDWERNLGINTLDFGTVHLYPDPWGKNLTWAEAWITDHIDIGQGVGKPVVFEEFGICYDDGENPHLLSPCSNTFNRDEAYIAWTNLFEEGAAGDLVWMIAGKVNSSNEDHKLINDEYYYPNYDGFTFWEPISSTMDIIRDHADQMNACCYNYLPLIAKDYSPQQMPPIDFEGDCQGWGKQPLNQPPQPCEGVMPSTEVAHTGSYSLKFDNLGPYSSETTQDIGVSYDASNTKVSAFVFLPNGASPISVVIYVQDKNWGWHQSANLNLVPGQWNFVSFDMRGQTWEAPFKTLGLHFTSGNYSDPVFIDTVIIEP